jgi:RimJ/RimL family protein N-acetyltransferase
MFKYENNKIETERLILRRFCKEDAAKVAKICNSEKVYKGTLDLQHPYTLECAIGWIARHFASNPASGRVIQKCGMLYEGTFKEHIYKINRFEDIVQYGILNE